MKKKHVIRGLLVSSLAAASLGFAALGSPAHAGTWSTLCNNGEPTPGDTWVQVGTTVGAGVDSGTTGMVGVPVACVDVAGTPYGGGGGATIVWTATGVNVQPWLCTATACNPFLIPIDIPVS